MGVYIMNIAISCSWRIVPHSPLIFPSLCLFFLSLLSDFPLCSPRLVFMFVARDVWYEGGVFAISACDAGRRVAACRVSITHLTNEYRRMLLHLVMLCPGY
jgi:hypothetical protein